MTHCSDLTEDEHEALQQLTKSARTQSKIVTYGPEMHRAHVDALVEMGFLGYKHVGEKRYLTLIVACPHRSSVLPGQEVLSDERAHLRTLGVKCRSAAEARTPLTQEDPRVAGDPLASSSHDFFLTKGAKESLVNYFNRCSRRFRWSAGLTEGDGDFLGRHFKQWRKDGATTEDICIAIDRFFADLRTTPKQDLPPKVWKWFVARRATYGLGKKIDYAQRSRDSAEEVQRSQRAFMARHNEHEPAGQADSDAS